MVNVAIMTSPRQPSYLGQTLRSLFASDGAAQLHVRLVVDGANPAYVGNWKNHARVKVETLTVQRSAQLRKLPIARRIGETCFRCLKGAPAGPLVLLQDDVELAPHWLKATLDGAQEAELRLANRSRDGVPLPAEYVLALYTTKALGPNERPLALYKPAEFYGSQGLLFPAQVMVKLVPFFEAQRHHGLMDDMLLKQFFMEHGIHLHAINPNVVQHIGTSCTHQGHFHQSPTYGKG